MTRHTLKLCIFGSVAGLAAATPGWAQETTDADAAAVGDIVVTARRTEERLQDVPISMTVYSQQQLDNRNIVIGTDLATYTPSLSVNQRFGPERATFALRGFNQESYTSPTVGVYFADVTTIRFQGGTTSGNTLPSGSFMDLQNVQVLKGPQGTLFGRNTTGGAILLVPHEPTDKFEGWVAGELGNYDLRRGQAVLNVPLSDTFKVRLNVDRYSRDGYMRNRSGAGPKDFNDVNYWYARVGILANLTPDLENYTVISYSRSRTNGLAGRIVACDRNQGFADFTRFVSAAAACNQLDRQTARGDGLLDVEINTPDPQLHLTTWQIINTTTWKASDTLTVKNIASYGQFKERTNFSLYSLNPFIPAPLPGAGTPIQIAAFETTPGYPTTEQAAYTEELQLQGRSFDNRLNWVIGSYLEYSDPLGFGSSQNSFFGNCASPGGFICTAPLGFGVLRGSRAKFSFRTTAVFAQGTFEFNDQLSVTGGFRYTWNKVHGVDETINYTILPAGPPLAACNNNLLFGNVFNPADPRQCHNEITQKSNAPTWLIDLDYKPTGNILLYAKYARGYREGGLDFISPGTEPWRPEKVDAYEVGAKLTLRGAVSGYFNIAGFYNDFTNQQINGALIAKPNTGIGGGIGIVNAGTSRIQGIEVEASILPIENLRFDLGYTYLDTKVTEITPPILPPESPFQEVTTSSAVGDPLTLSPKNRITLTGTYTLPLSEDVGEVSLAATFTHTDKQVANKTDGAFGILPSSDLLNLNLNWNNVLGQPIDLSVFAVNVTDEVYAVTGGGALSSLGFATVFYGAPRMYGVRLRYNFGE